MHACFLYSCDLGVVELLGKQFSLYDSRALRPVWERREKRGDMVACHRGGGRGYWLLAVGEGRDERHACRY